MKLSETILPPRKYIIRHRYDFEEAVADACDEWMKCPQEDRERVLTEMSEDIIERLYGYEYEEMFSRPVDLEYVKRSITQEEFMRVEFRMNVRNAHKEKKQNKKYLPL